MKALVFDDQLRLTEAAQPQPRPEEALIKVLLAGICNTDLEIVRGYMGFRGILGHEFVGVVEEASASEWIGKRVVGEINLACGTCEFCRRGLNRHCPNRSVLGILQKDGAFAEYLTLPRGNLFEVLDSISDEEAVFVEPLAASLEILEQVKIEPGWRVAVVGDGKLAILVAQVLKLTGCGLIVLGKHEEKLAILRAMGVATTFTTEPLQGKFDLVVEASGSPSGLPIALDLLRPRGILVFKSTFQGDLNFNPARMVIDEVTLIGSRCGPFAPAIRLLQNRLVNVRPLISHVLPFGDALKAFAVAQHKKTLKVLLKF